MKLVTPSAELQKLELLEASLREVQSPNTVVPGFSAELINEMTVMLPQYRAQFEAQLQARENWKTKLQQCQALEKTLRHRIRDAFQVVKRETRNPEFPKSLFEAFGLLRDGVHSKQTQRLKAPIQMARRIVAAHTSAVAQGLDILKDPVPEELSTLADSLAVAKDALTEARNLERQAFDALQASRGNVNLLIGRIKANSQLLTVGMTAQKKRETLQALGFKYRSKAPVATDADVQDAEDQNAQEPSDVDGHQPIQENDTASPAAEDQAA